jgi:hypothetical protein
VSIIHRAGLLSALAILLSCVVPRADALPISYAFTIDVTSGPLAGDISSGTFAFDSSSVTPGGFNKQTGLLTALSFDFNGVAYDQTTVNTGFLFFDPSGALEGFCFGNDVVAGACNFGRGDITISSQSFGYDSDTGAVSTGTAIFSAAPAPEPASLALLALGLPALLLVCVRRPLTLFRTPRFDSHLRRH